ncbi:ribonucleotide-diphosphate reductase subunit beta [Candidatus Gracilibacteria bacterium]|nr:ribonucleotide-diphosphate reductase subunit beta [Candidatus Gracilibacteria bacterium]
MTNPQDAGLGVTLGTLGNSKDTTKKKSVLGNSATDPNKILPITYKWARNYYKQGVANNWTPEEVPMASDVELWKSKDGLSEDERRMVLWNLGFFSTAESLTANNIVLTIYKHVTNPECRQYLLRQAFEEAIHTDTFIYCCDSLSLDPDEIYNMYLTIPSIEDKDQFVVDITKSLLDPNFQIRNTKDMQQFVFDLVGFYVIMEGIFFYAGFAMMLSMLRNHKMIGVGEQFQYILRDESIHLAFGVDLINTIKEENPEIWTDEFKQSLIDAIKKSVDLEQKYAVDSLPRGILGLRADVVNEYVAHIADRRLESIGLPVQYNAKNPFPWMSEVIDLAKEKNFFESRVTEYQQGGSLGW